MTKGKNTSRKPQKIVRTPATKFSHLRKKATGVRNQNFHAKTRPGK